MKRTRLSVLTAKLEPVGGGVVVPSPTEDAFEVANTNHTPMETDKAKSEVIRPYFGAKQEMNTTWWSSIEFTIEVALSGLKGKAPKYERFLRACGTAMVVTADTSVEFTPITDNPELITIHYSKDGELHQLVNARGSVSFDGKFNELLKLRFKFVGKAQPVTDQIKAMPTYETLADKLIFRDGEATATVFGLDDMGIESVSLDLANDLQKFQVLGVSESMIVERSPSLKLVVMARKMADVNWYDKAINNKTGAIKLVFGNKPGSILQLDMPKVAVNGLGDTDKNGVRMLEISGTVLPVAGNDELKITLK